MPDAQPLGPAYSWQVNGQWFYSARRKDAPEDAIFVERYQSDGEVVLYERLNAAGRFIRGAKPWRS